MILEIVSHKNRVFYTYREKTVHILLVLLLIPVAPKCHTRLAYFTPPVTKKTFIARKVTGKDERTAGKT